MRHGLTTVAEHLESRQLKHRAGLAPALAWAHKRGHGLRSQARGQARGRLHFSFASTSASIPLLVSPTLHL